MGREFDEYTFTEETEIEIEGGSLTLEEADWLRENGLLHIVGHKTQSGEITNAEFDASKLARIAFEYDLLNSVASSVEVDVLEAFRTASENVMTTRQLTEATGRPKSSVSRALGKLTEKGKVTKIQDGVYRR